jgi:5'-methylthioadenosine phosphorylase
MWGDYMIKIGIIGGSGLDDPKILADYKEIEVDTPYGKPSSPLTIGKLSGVEVVILARHGKNHTIMPTNVPFQANIWALKEQGCTHILATSACGSLREDIKPGDLVLADQFIDRTTRRNCTFYEQDKICHIPMAEPFCPKLRKLTSKSCEKLGLRHHHLGTVITIEGPRFSTKAESNMFRMWKADVINMSTVPEVVLAREAGICYQVIAMSTDYDCWHESEKPVDIAMVLETMRQNSENVKKLLLVMIPLIRHTECGCREAIKTAVI